jgi:hypothetical protein
MDDRNPLHDEPPADTSETRPLPTRFGHAKHHVEPRRTLEPEVAATDDDPPFADRGDL